MPIRRLPPRTVDRIAAGEVVERPANAVKELVENALDAGASQVEVQVEGGGLRRILVADDGAPGWTRASWPWRWSADATSKLPERADGEADLLDISTLGFRGEALPSIASVSRLTLTSRPRAGGEAHGLRVEAGAVGAVGPAAFSNPKGGSHGARVEVRDLFHATPARLKFMRSERAEALAVADELRRHAMARPHRRLHPGDRRPPRVSSWRPSPRARRDGSPGWPRCWAATSRPTPWPSTTPATACA